MKEPEHGDAMELEPVESPAPDTPEHEAPEPGAELFREYGAWSAPRVSSAPSPLNHKARRRAAVREAVQAYAARHVPRPRRLREPETIRDGETINQFFMRKET